jgi:PAS domain S-box-containing protein
MSRFSGLRWRASIVAVLAVAMTGAALSVALVAAANARARSHELSHRLVPAAAEAGALLGTYTAQQTALRDYVTDERQPDLAAFRQAGQHVPAQQARLAGLIRGYGQMPAELTAVEAAQRAWLAKVAGPEVSAATRGDVAGAQAIQADIPFVRPYVVAVRSRMANLQAHITAAQGRVTSLLIKQQRILLAALVAAFAVVAAIVLTGVLVVRYWLLRPFLALRQAADAIAAGDYETEVPAVGPPELADLGRSAELMRTRPVAALLAAESAEQGFRSLFDSAPEATLAVSRGGSITMVNAQAQRLLKYDVGELVGKTVDILVPAGARGAHPDHRAAYLAEPKPRPMGAGLELFAVAKDGQQIPVEISLSPLPEATGMAVCVSIRDITERLAAESERDRLRAEAERERYVRRMQQSERLESLGQLVGGVAHDFNNLLNVIAGYNDFTAHELERLAAADQQLVPILEDVGQVRSATERATRLTHQLLTFARRDVVRPEILDVNNVVTGLEQLLRRTLGEHVTLVISPGAGIWRVKADVGQLEQVIVNLAVNGRDAMPAGGTLTIDTSNVDVDEMYAASRPELKPGRYARLRLSDTGCGMKPEVLARVCEPFYSTKPPGKGTGLGLSTVHGIVTRAGGCLQLYSEPGLGTTVSALFPATDEEAPCAQAPGPVTVLPAGRGETILLAEDERSLRELTTRILTRNGYQVCAADSPADAIQLAKDRDQRIDLLLTDVVMPNMLGNELAGQIRCLRPGIAVLYMSGYAQSMLDTQGALANHVDLLEKPFSESAVLRRVREAIDNGGAQHVLD